MDRSVATRSDPGYAARHARQARPDRMTQVLCVERQIADEQVPAFARSITARKLLASIFSEVDTAVVLDHRATCA